MLSSESIDEAVFGAKLEHAASRSIIAVGDHRILDSTTVYTVYGTPVQSPVIGEVEVA
jgi:hypothetical protein